MSFTWDPDTVDKLKRLWAAGLSASQIERRLGATSRSAVIGKIHRLGLSRTRSGHRPRSSNAQSRARKPKAQQPHWDWGNRKSARLFARDNRPLCHEPDPTVPEKERVGVVDLGETQCRWPIGDPKLPDFHFCNGKQIPGLPYCELHCRKAFVPPDPRRHYAPRGYKRMDRTVAVDALLSGDAPIHTGDKETV